MRQTRTTRWLTVPLMVSVLALGTAACGDDGETPGKETAVDTDESRRQVEEALRSAVQVVESAGLTMRAATGSWAGCGMEESAGVEYAAGGTVEGGDDPVQLVAAARDALEQDGWSVEGSGDTPRPFATLARDDLRVSVVEDRLDPGRVSLTVLGDCVRSGRDTDTSLTTEEYDVPL